MKTWKEIVTPVLSSDYMVEFRKWLKSEREIKKIYPSSNDTLKAFELCPYKNVKVVIFGQDPYHSPETADGLAFSTQQEKRPYSLNNIFKEIYTDLNIQYFHNETMDEFFPNNSLEGWARNGFLLLNTTLTVEEAKPLSHEGKGWERLINVVIDALNKHEKRLVFLLWGKRSQSLEEKIDTDKHVVFKAPHPAADVYKSAGEGFLGCKHFSIVRDILPTIHYPDARQGIILNSCFDKDKAAQIVRREYPSDADRIIHYIQKEMIIHIPVNKDQYYQELKKFELSLSTKIK